MKKIMQIALILLIPTGMLFGQQSATTSSPTINMSKVQAESHQLAKDLQLSPNQESQVFRVNVEYENQIDSYNKSLAPRTKEEYNAKLKEIDQNRTNKLKTILTPSQMEQYVKVHPAMQ